MEIFFSKRNKVYEIVERYLDKMLEAAELFKKTMEKYFETGLSREFIEMIETTHLSESMADDIRREIELEMYEKSLIPESRGDILGLLEVTDEVMNKAQSVLYQIETENLEIPQELKDDFIKLIHNNISAFEVAVDGFRILFHNLKAVREKVQEVDKRESSSDRMERDLIRKIFAANYDIGKKILLKDLVIEIGNISDTSEEVTDRLNIVAAKRMV
jgi:predicted phosphate transport protein (TIGR00153 family)